MEYLKNKNIEIVVFLDGDYSDDPKEINQLIQPIETNEYECPRTNAATAPPPGVGDIDDILSRTAI